MITSRRLKTRWETRAPWTGAIVIPVLSASRTHRGQRYASDFCCALPRTAARRSKAATGAATASTCSLQLGLAYGCSGAASRRRGRIYRSTREDSTTNGPRQQTRPRRVVVSNEADFTLCGCGDALLSASFSFVGTYLVWREHAPPCESCLVCHKRSSVASSSTIDDGLPVVGVPTRAPGAADVFTILDTPSTRIGTVPWSARRRGLLPASRQLSTAGV